MDPTPFPAPQKSGGNYFVGLGLGSIPLILFLGIFAAQSAAAPGSFLVFLLYASLILYVVVLIAAIVCLFIGSIRWIGYGLLTAFLVSPVVAYIGCLVIVRIHS